MCPVVSFPFRGNHSVLIQSVSSLVCSVPLLRGRSQAATWIWPHICSSSGFPLKSLRWSQSWTTRMKRRTGRCGTCSNRFSDPAWPGGQCFKSAFSGTEIWYLQRSRRFGKWMCHDWDPGAGNRICLTCEGRHGMHEFSMPQITICHLRPCMSSSDDIKVSEHHANHASR